jgi:uncharacterized UPF0146 family protein
MGIELTVKDITNEIAKSKSIIRMYKLDAIAEPDCDVYKNRLEVYEVRLLNLENHLIEMSKVVNSEVNP